MANSWVVYKPKHMFSKKSLDITKEDIRHLERVVGCSLPADFINHYLSGNGGVSEKNYFYVEDNDGYVEISFFLPILPESNNLEDMSIGTTYKDLVSRVFYS